jgi:hypothetical protein
MGEKRKRHPYGLLELHILKSIGAMGYCKIFLHFLRFYKIDLISFAYHYLEENSLPDCRKYLQTYVLLKITNPI